VGAFISAGERRLLEPQKQLYRFTEPTTARAIPPRRLSIGSNPTEASKPLPIWRGTGFSNPFPSSAESGANHGAIVKTHNTPVGEPDFSHVRREKPR
jgi:hypothetical protein